MSAQTAVAADITPSVRKSGRAASSRAASATRETYTETTVNVPAGDKVKIKANEIDVAPAKGMKGAAAGTMATAGVAELSEKDAKKIAKEEMKEKKKAEKQAAKGECAKFGGCPPLTLFIVFAIIVLVWQAFQAWNKAPAAGTPGRDQLKYWLIVGFTFLVMLAIIFAIGWWIKSECNHCEPGKAWLIFVLAIFLPIVVGFIFSVIVGALRGGASFIDKWLGKDCDPAVPGNPMKKAEPKKEAKETVKEAPKKETKKAAKKPAAPVKEETPVLAESESDDIDLLDEAGHTYKISEDEIDGALEKLKGN